MDRVLKRCHISNRLVRECFAEFLGVYVLILFGCGSVAQVTTSKNSKGEYLSINLAFALGTTFGIYVSKGISDAIIYYSGDHLTVSGPTGTAGIFSTYPAEYLSVWGGVVDQVIGTAALMVCVLALGDSRNFPGPPGLEPVLVGAVVMVIGLSMGSNSGYALNPARDLGPRIFTCIAGWGTEVFRGVTQRQEMTGDAVNTEGTETLTGMQQSLTQIEHTEESSMGQNVAAQHTSDDIGAQSVIDQIEPAVTDDNTTNVSEDVFVTKDLSFDPAKQSEIGEITACLRKFQD
ncbi:aquaporin-10b isoform X5 [Tachysurus fulvidraco]|uniref:aquaporin-10b isoform X5 n=1 Tax=Tachysurus fulvidraco TaxID=1234273 RepID=UPI000F4D65F5|nr:aquaporin-10b isoform X5 [Tachysurus fulvidraco]